jgi:uncharacterized protein (TIRG00374 family)
LAAPQALAAPQGPAAPRPSLSRSHVVKVALGLAVSAGLLVYLFWRVDFATLASRLASTHWGWFAVAVALQIAALWLRALRWHYLFPPGARPTHLFRAVMIAYMGNNVLPLRAGEVLRVYVPSRHGQSFWTVAGTVVVERVLDGVAIGVMLAAVFLLMPVPRELEWAALVFLSADLALIVALAAVIAAPAAAERFVTGLVRRWPALERRAHGLLAPLFEGLAGIRTPRHWAPIIGHSVAIWLTVAVAIWAAFRAAHLMLPLGAAWTALAFVGLGISLPSSPGFAGVVQAAVVVALGLFGVDRSEALAASIVMHASSYLPVTAWGLILLASEGLTLSAARTAGAQHGATPRQG